MSCFAWGTMKVPCSSMPLVSKSTLRIPVPQGREEEDYMQFCTVTELQGLSIRCLFRGRWSLFLFPSLSSHSVFLRSFSLIVLRKFEEAAQECTAALRIHPTYMKAILRRGRCYARLQRHDESVAEFMRWLQLAEDAKKPDSYATVIAPCLFDGPRDVTNEQIKVTKQELEDVLKLKERKAYAAREQECYRQQREQFHQSYSDAHRRRDHWYNQQGVSGSRRWDSFDKGPGSKHSPKQRNSRRNANSRRGSQHTSSWRAETNANISVTHYSVLQVPQSASEAEIKKAYRKVGRIFIF